MESRAIAPLMEYRCDHIRKYGSTFYIGIAMVIFPYFGSMEKRFHFQFPLNLTSTNITVGSMLIASDIRKESRKLVIQV